MIKNQSITINDFVIQKSGNVLSDMDGEKVMLSIQNGKYYNLGKIGGHIWEEINKSILVSDVVAKLLLEYDVEKSECEEQVVAFLEMLLNEDLIERL